MCHTPGRGQAFLACFEFFGRLRERKVEERKGGKMQITKMRI